MHISADELIADLRREGLRITGPRRAICEVLSEAHADHLTAADILEETRRRSDTGIDPSTVYRTLEVLERAGAISHSHLGHGASVYHLADEAGHQHLICSNCGATMAIPESDLGEFLSYLEDKTGFVPDPTHFALSGLCRDCVDAQSK